MVLEGVKEAVVKFLKGGGTYDAAVQEFIKDLQRELIKSDVNVKLVFELTNRIKERASKESPPPGASRREWFITIVYQELSELFGGDKQPRVQPPKTPWIMLLVGVQGSGKTTTAGKLAYYYTRKGYRVALISTDTYRPGALEQLRTLAEKVGAVFYGENKGDPAEIAKRGVEYALERKAEVIIVDTAGRHGFGDEEALIEEMKSIAKAVNPDEVILVIDAAIGQKAYELARKFHEATPIGSLIVTKLDGTARGGGVLSAAAATGATVKFIGTGEKIEELEPFRPAKFVGRILGLGDIEALVERVTALEEAESLEEAAEDLMKGKINMRVIYRQLKSMRKIGPFSKVLQMLPGAGLLAKLDDEAVKLGEEKIDKWLAIIESMTYQELEKPEIIDRSRMKRLALGSGTSVEDVRELLAYYKNIKLMMMKLKRDKRLLKRLGLS